MALVVFCRRSLVAEYRDKRNQEKSPRNKRLLVPRFVGRDQADFHLSKQGEAI